MRIKPILTYIFCFVRFSHVLSQRGALVQRPMQKRRKKERKNAKTACTRQIVNYSIHCMHFAVMTN